MNNLQYTIAFLRQLDVFGSWKTLPFGVLLGMNNCFNLPPSNLRDFGLEIRGELYL